MSNDHNDEEHECDDDCIYGFEYTKEGVKPVRGKDIKAKQDRAEMEMEAQAIKRRNFIRRMVEDQENLECLIEMFTDVATARDPRAMASYLAGVFQGHVLCMYKYTELDAEEAEAVRAALNDD